MPKLLISASIGALMAAGAGGAFAQTSTDTTAMDPMGPSGLKCSDISSLDNESAGEVLYYVAGYMEGQKSSDMSPDTTASTAGDTTDTTAGAATETTPGAETDTTAGAATGTDTTAGAATDTTDPATTGATADASALMARIGASDIQVEQVMSACNDAPESSVSDILGQQGTTAQ